SFQALNNASGPPAARTGGPGESNCTVGCHSGSVITTGTNWNNISLTTNIPSGGYTPGTTYTITLSMTVTGISKWGFEATVLDGSGNMAGSFIAGTGSSIQTSGSRSYINHNSSGNLFSNTASWTFSWTAPSVGVSGITFYTTVNAANNDGNTSGDQIYTKSFTFGQFGVGPPTAVITTTPNPATVCVGDTVYFSGSGNNNPSSYSWTFGNNATPQSSTLQNPKVVYNVGGTFNAALVTTNSYGSSPFTTKSITVYAKPSSVVTPSGSLSLCGPNDSITLNAATGTGLLYLWFPGNQTTASIVVKNSGTYRVTITNANNCSATSANIVVAQHNIPVVTLISSADSICNGDSVTFSGTNNFLNYRFYRDTTTVQNTSLKNYSAANFLTSDVFSLIATDSFGCKSLPSNSKSVTVRTPVSAPIVTCGTQTSSSVQFNWTALSNVNGYEMSADTGKTWSTPSSGTNGLFHTVSGLTGGKLVNIKVRALTSGACTHGLAATQTCQTLGCPYVSFTYSAPKNSCLQSDTSSHAENISISNVNAIKYSVNINNTGYSSTLSKQVNIIKGINNIHIKILDSMNIGCPQTDSIIVITGINSPASNPILSFTSSGLDTLKQFCFNNIQNIFSTQPVGTNKYLFMRNLTDTMQIGSTNSWSSLIKKYATNDKANVIAIDTVFGCSKISNQLTVIVNPLPKAAFGYTAAGSTLQFTDSSTGKIKIWTWNFGDNSTTSILKNPNHTFPSLLIYNISLAITDSNNCSDSIGKSIQITNTGIDKISAIQNLNIYPNPSSENIKATFEMKENSDLEMMIIDVNGREVYRYQNMEEQSGQKEFDFSIQQYPNGIYLMMIRSGGKIKVMKFIKQ
ncbi:MAG: choice-of-anchor V domain-containing protein, partial [Bacteroidota bacterium]